MAGTCPLSTGFQVTDVPSLSVEWNCTFHKTGAGFPETVGLEVIIHRFVTWNGGEKEERMEGGDSCYYFVPPSTSFSALHVYRDWVKEENYAS
ncbi:hypothetical protein TNCT_654691 [Trichonephila clavata]|uniref:Uncharacterized protein n=1 Tax=Trichonephila clavata TaxID=2740835 RepID=A0A8X6LCI8_TRICU|nr:hypothetical protein TNCT_654691 [Trichonephila clavata]